jgi:hypothetical protein
MNPWGYTSRIARDICAPDHEGTGAKGGEHRRDAFWWGKESDEKFERFGPGVGLPDLKKARSD